jgi:outer membrane protein, multidrug efflux system
MSASSFAAAGIAVLTLSACPSMAPPYQRPAPPIAAAFPADAPPAVGEVVNRSLNWRSVFVNAELQQLIEQGLANNRDLRSAVLRVEEARALSGIQHAELFPDIALVAGENRTRTPPNLSPTGDAVITSAYQVGVGLISWEVDFWGRLRSLDSAATERYLATDASRRAFMVSLVGQIANAWLTQRELDRRLEFARRAVATREETLRIFRRRVEEGATARFDLTQVEVLVTQAQALHAQLEQARAANAHALTLLIGTPVELAPEPQALEGSPGPVHAVAAGLPSELIVLRPDIIAAERQLRAANANIGAARAAFFPQVTLTGNYGTASAELDDLFTSGTHAWSIAPNIVLPIFDGGRLRSNLELSKTRRELAVASYEVTIQGAFRDVADALSASQWLTQQAAIQRDALAAVTERARLAQLRYDRGSSAFLEVLEAQRDLLDTEQTLVQAERAVLSSRVGVFTAMGGGALGATE